MLLFAALFTLRSLDDNRLVRWDWVFNTVSATWIYAALTGGVLLAWAASRLPAPRPALLGVLSFIICALFWRTPEAIVDASRYFTQAKHLELYGVGFFLAEWGGQIGAWTDLPLMPFVYGLAFKVFGESRIVTQVITTVMFSATVVLTARIGKELWDETVGLAAGALLMAVPYLYTQVPLMLVDVPSMFFLTLALYTVILALRRGGAAIFIASVAVFFVVFSKYSLWLMLSVLVVTFLVLLKEAPGAVLRRGGGIFLLGAVLAGGLLLYKMDVVAQQIRFLIEYQRPGLGRWSESFTSTFLFHVHPFVTAAALYSAYRAARKKDLKYLVVLWLPALMLLMGIRRIRYLVPVFPMLCLMAGYGLAGIRAAELRRFVVSVAVVFSVVLATLAYLPFLSGLSMSNLTDAGEFLDGMESPKVRVVTLSMDSDVNPAIAVPLLDIFTEKEIAYEQAGHEPPDSVDLEKLPLRFTWEHETPPYYLAGPDGEDVIAVISDRPPQVPDGYVEVGVFDRYDGIFRFRTFVTVYSRAAQEL